MIDTRIRFGDPYSNDSDKCTGVKMVHDGFVREVPIKSPSGIILYPYCDVDLSDKDCELAIATGIDLVDAPWESLDNILSNLRECTEKGIIVRRIPLHYIAQNEFYRKNNPIYFSAPTRFSTVEALVIALDILKEYDQADKIAKRYKLSYIMEWFQ
jgi:ribosome biogenesis protein Tsr3